MARILIVEDEKRIQDIVVEFLQKDGHDCIVCDDGIEAFALLKINSFDLMVLDIMMRHIDGLSVCKLVREISNMPIIMLTAKNDVKDKLKGYEYGVDDYMTKPFSPQVLCAKVNALLNRVNNMSNQNSVIAGNITINSASRIVHAFGEEIDLTHKEFELLNLFIKNQNQVFSREKLLNRIWGFDFEGNARTVDSHIKTLRQKLGEEGRHIVTLIRSGYKFEVKND